MRATAATHQSWFGTASVLLAVVVSALGLVYSSHVCRAYYAELQDLEASRWQLQEDYSRLLLEQSTLASPHRVATVARDELSMQSPELSAERVVAP